jgi:putative ABC transport system substrate-binding protein
VRRRDFISLLGGASVAPSFVGRAVAAGKMARVGIIDDSPAWDPFRQQLGELKYVEGQNIAFEYHRADGVPDRLLAAASDLAQIPVDVIAVFGTPAAQAAQRTTKNIPVVAISIGDPVGAGLVTSFARPGGNITGNTILAPDVATKRLQILKDAKPAAARVAFLWNPDNASNSAILEQLRKAMPLFEMTLVPLRAREADDFERISHMAAVIDCLLRSRIAGMFQIRQNVADGGLMSYGASFTDLFRRGALYVDKILHGTAAGDLPFEQPVTFELVINLKTARAIGLDIPPALLARADEVIE